MDLKDYPYQSDFAKKYVAEGEQDALLTVLRARGLELPEDLLARVRARGDRKILKRWIERAVGASKIEEVFDG